MIIPEEFIVYVWRNKLFNHENLKTTDGQPLRILHAGILNNNQGPDFIQAKVQIGEVILVGNIEIHVKSSDWDKHQHGKDNAYQNIILHVVYNDDKTLINNTGQSFPTLELNGKIFPSLLKKYHQLNRNTQTIKCSNLIKNFDTKELLKIESWKERMVVERMIKKSELIIDELKTLNNDWAQLLFSFFGKYMGGKLNGDAFYLLCKSTPLNVLHKHRNRLLSVEAILFGQAGMLEEDFEDTYYQSLKQEYTYFKKAYNLKSLKLEMWKFFRLRPVSFPTIRIAQLAELIHRYFSFSLSDLEVESWEKTLQSVSASGYWDNHYVFGKKTKQSKPKHMGKQLIEGLQINAMIPFKMAYSKSQGNMAQFQESIELLHKMGKENNDIIRFWERVGFESKDAYDSQAYNEWTTNYCMKSRCIDCAIGNMLLKTSYNVIENKENSIFRERKVRWRLRNPERFSI
jgi:hypothetical protein